MKLRRNEFCPIHRSLFCCRRERQARKERRFHLGVQRIDDPHHPTIFDRDAKFGADLVSTVKAMGRQPIRTAYRSPWQNGIAERWVGSVRRELLDRVIMLNRRHLRRLLNDYVRYCHDDKTHLGLAKDTPESRVSTLLPSQRNIISLPRLGGLHHRYSLAT